MSASGASTFRSLRLYNYRLWAGGAIVSNIGTWMQRMAQDWLVLTQLTDHNATAVGIVMSLQFGPQLVLLPFTGFAADHFDRRKLIMATQAASGLLAFGLGLLTLFGVAQLWHVYVFALLSGCVNAFDAPARQTFVSELVGEKDLPNAVALNAASFNVARLVGPAAAGVLVAGIGTSWVFLINGLSFVAVLGSLAMLRLSEIQPTDRADQASGSLLEGFRYVWRRPDIMVVLVMIFVIGTFGLNFPIFISTMSVTAFHAGAGEYGLLASTIAIGSIAGALMSARRTRPRITLLLTSAVVFTVGTALAAVMPTPWLFGACLVPIGVAAQTFTTTSNSLVQLTTEPAMRGRVMAILLAILLGGTPIGAPFVGWVADTFGPRWALGIASLSGLIGAFVCLRYLVKHRQFSMRFAGGRFKVSIDGQAV